MPYDILREALESTELVDQNAGMQYNNNNKDFILRGNLFDNILNNQSSIRSSTMNNELEK